VTESCRCLCAFCAPLQLDPQEIVIAEAGSFMMMDNNIQMETIFGDGSEQKSGIFGQLLNAGKSSYRQLIHDRLYQSSQFQRKSVFASLRKNFTSDLTEFQEKFICQKLFLCSQRCICWN
jgi:hypothetical protein